MARPWFADEKDGNDTTGDGTIGTPYKTVRKCLDMMNVGAGDYIYFKPYYWDWNKPNPGIWHTSSAWAYCIFVDPANGTDSTIAPYGRSDGSNALASLQYAIDNWDEYSDHHRWIFCKGTETPGAQIDLDNYSQEGCWSVIEGYTTDPRDGGYYNLDGEDSVGTALKYANQASGALVANIHAYNYTGSVVDLGGVTQGSWGWNIWAEPAATRYGFYSGNWLNYVYLLFCRSTGGTASFYLYQAALAYMHCCYGENATSYGVYTTMNVITNRCVMRSTTRGYCCVGGRVIALDSVAHDCSEYGLAQTAQAGILLAMGSVAKDCGVGFQRDNGGGGQFWAMLLNADAHGNSPNYQDLQVVEGMLQVDPGFVDADNGDFRMAAGSGLWNGGVGVHPLISGQRGHIGPHVPRMVAPANSHLAAAGNPQGVAHL